MTTQRLGPWAVTVTREQIPIYSNSPQPDKNWRHVDQQEHEHVYGLNYPTLVYVEDEPWWCEEHSEFHEAGHYECPLCGEHIEPGLTGSSPFPTYINGPKDVRLTYDDGRERREYAILTAEAAEALIVNPDSFVSELPPQGNSDVALLSRVELY